MPADRSGVEYGVLGTGALAAAIVTGLCDGVADPPAVRLSPRNAEVAASLAARFSAAQVARDNQAAVDGADVVLVCVRPEDGESVLSDLTFGPGQVLVSAMAGITVERLASWVAPATRVARVIPLPAVARREGVTPVHPPLPGALALFDALGGSIPIDEERTFEALSASTATIGAHFAYLGSIARWLVAQGMPAEEGRSYVAAMFAGLAGSLRDGVPAFDELTREVATPGGLNEQFATSLARAGVYDAVHRALEEVLDRITAQE